MPTAESLAINHLSQFFPSLFMLHLNTNNWVVLAGKEEVTLQAMLSAEPNIKLPASLSSRLHMLQGRLLKVNRKRKINFR